MLVLVARLTCGLPGNRATLQTYLATRTLFLRAALVVGRFAGTRLLARGLLLLFTTRALSSCHLLLLHLEALLLLLLLLSQMLLLDFLCALRLLLVFEEVVTLFKDCHWQLWSADVVHLLMVDEDLWRQALQDPDMLEGFIGSQPIMWVPNEAFLHEICKIGVLVADDQAERLS